MVKKRKKRINKPKKSVGKGGMETMAISQQQLKTLLDEALAKMTAARPKVDSFAALITTLKQQLADAIANAVDLTEAAASVASLMGEYEAQVGKISAAADVVPGP